MLTNIIVLIVDTAATVVAVAFLLRFWMQAVRVRPPDAIARLVFQLSNWLVLPLRRILPGIGGYDWACLIGAMLMALIAVLPTIWIMSLFATHVVILLALQQLLSWIIYGFIGLLIIEAIFSWVNPHAPLAPLVSALNDPLLRPLRRLIPSLGGLDLSVLVALVLLRIALQIISSGLAALL